jgi:hypothetical protein
MLALAMHKEKFNGDDKIKLNQMSRVTYKNQKKCVENSMLVMVRAIARTIIKRGYNEKQ